MFNKGGGLMVLLVFAMGLLAIACGGVQAQPVRPKDEATVALADASYSYKVITITGGPYELFYTDIRPEFVSGTNWVCMTNVLRIRISTEIESQTEFAKHCMFPGEYPATIQSPPGGRVLDRSKEDFVSP